MFMVFKFNNQQKDIVAKLIEDKEQCENYSPRAYWYINTKNLLSKN